MLNLSLGKSTPSQIVNRHISPFPSNQKKTRSISSVQPSYALSSRSSRHRHIPCNHQSRYHNQYRRSHQCRLRVDYVDEKPYSEDPNDPKISGPVQAHPLYPWFQLKLFRRHRFILSLRDDSGLHLNICQIIIRPRADLPEDPKMVQ